VEHEPLDPASSSLVEALAEDPFYTAISVEQKEPAARRRGLAGYFSYLLEEARLLGRCLHLDDGSIGAAAWLLPGNEERRRQASIRKCEFLKRCLGSTGRKNYDAIVAWMSERSAPQLRNAWYLSIVGIAPHAQGQGLGRQLLLPTLHEAARAGAVCYLETFSARNVRFYERLGFCTLGVFLEPTTKSEYSLMVRYASEAQEREKNDA
jgi:ribosomal protein S18 acetylase RimI-like enzyme